MRYAITLAYNGTNFFGSQIQKETNNTVFGTIEHILKQLGIDEKVVVSGRTDRGVHATAQVCHVDLPPFWDDIAKFKKVLEKMVPASLQIKKIQKVNDTFHARYSAKKRVYRYIIKEAKSNPFEESFVTFLEDVNFEQIEKNIKLFLGEHDFKYFMKTGSDSKSTTRIIYRAFAYKHKGFFILNFEANGFLRSQIRLMVGALLKLTATQIQEQIEGNKIHKIKPACSNGLYLARIKY